MTYFYILKIYLKVIFSNPNLVRIERITFNKNVFYSFSATPSYQPICSTFTFPDIFIILQDVICMMHQQSNQISHQCSSSSQSAVLFKKILFPPDNIRQMAQNSYLYSSYFPTNFRRVWCEFKQRLATKLVLLYRNWINFAGVDSSQQWKTTLERY